MGKQGTLGNHADKAGDDTGGTGEKEAVDDMEVCEQLPDCQEKKQHKNPGKVDEMMMASVSKQEKLLVGQCLVSCFHWIVPPRSD